MTIRNLVLGTLAALIILVIGFRVGHGRWPSRLSWLPFNGTGSETTTQPVFGVPIQWAASSTPINGGSDIGSDDDYQIVQVWDGLHPETAYCILTPPGAKIRVDGENGSTPLGTYWTLNGDQNAIQTEFAGWPAKFKAQSGGLECKSAILGQVDLGQLSQAMNLKMVISKTGTK